MRTAVVAVLALLPSVVLACSSSSSVPAAPAGDVTPAAICKPHADLPTTPWFTDVTSAVGLDGVQAVRVSAVDLDGDGLVDLVFHTVATTRDAPPTTYAKRVFMNKGGTFVDATAESGLLDSRDGPGTGRLSHLSVFADVDNDGDLDMFEGTYQDGTATAPASNDVSEVWLNDGKGHFTMAPQSAPSVKLPISGATFLDYDQDGIVDLFVSTWYDQLQDEGAGSYLYTGLGDGTFADVSAQSGVLRPATHGDIASFLAGKSRRAAYGVTSCDVDNDGDPDLLVSAYGRGWNELWRNDAGKFTEIAQGTPVAADDDLEYHDNEFYHCWCAQPANAGKCTPADSQPKISCTNFSWNPGLDDQPARLGGNNFTTACGDLDNDGDLDLIHANIRHWHIGESSDPSEIVRNDLANGVLKFTRLPNDATTMMRTHATSDWNEGDMDVGMFDFDDDGKKDVWLSSSDYPNTWGTLFQQQKDGTLKDVSDAANVHHYHAHGFATVDIDGDGDLDLVVTTSGARCSGDPLCPAVPTIKVYRNDVGSLRNVLRVRLHGTGQPGGANRAAIGARVNVTAGGVTQTLELDGGYGHFGMQDDTVLTFGLGDACVADTVDVMWPNATHDVDHFTKVGANYMVDVTESAAGGRLSYVVAKTNP